VREAKLRRVDGAFEGDLDPHGAESSDWTPSSTFAVLGAPLAQIVGKRFGALTRL
jgi:hypothetical protein